MRENTERPITIKEGTNILIGTDSDKILIEINKILNYNEKKGSIPELWDGKSAERIIDIILKNFEKEKNENSKYKK